MRAVVHRLSQRLLIAAVLVPLLTLSGGGAIATAGSKPSAAQTSAYAVDGLMGPAEILIDTYGIPHMYASAFYDAFFVQGFNAARDRLWQIDTWRRRGLGQLSEVLGPSYVDQDRAARLFLYRGDMYREWLSYGSDTKQVATAFTGGINAYVRLTQQNPDLLPPEFKFLNYQPAVWSPEDVVRIRSHGLISNLRNEVTRARVVRDFGLDVEGLRTRLEPTWATNVPDGTDLSLIPDDLLKVYDLATGDVRFTAPVSAATDLASIVQQVRDDKTLGSNNWTISAERTATGRPILANDPHRTQSVPSLRYISHLVAPGLDVIGAGEPALPGISIGHNERIAFGLTIFAVDQEDLYIYQTNPADPNQYWYQDAWEPMQIDTQPIDVTGREPVSAELKFTRHGPVIYEDPSRHVAFAVRTAWQEPGMAPYLGSIDYMRAKTWDQFLAAMNRWESPSENQVYADTDGNIGWKPGGLTPIRPNWDGLLPVPGDGRYEWAGFRTMDELPVESNPSRGWIASANQMNLPPTFPYQDIKPGFEWTPPFRVQRINEVLAETPHASLEDNLRLQTDHVSLPARRVIRQLGGLQSNDPTIAAGLDLLRQWNFDESVDSSAATLWETWWRQYLGQAFMARLVPPQALGAVGGGDPRDVLDLVEHPDNRLGPNPTSTRNDVLLTSLGQAIDRTAELLGSDPSKRAWGELHHELLEHPMAPVLDPTMRAAFNVGPLPRGGGNDTVGNTSYRISDFNQTGGSSFRMVLDVGAWDNSLTMNTPGQSGNPNSSHYADLFAKWARDEAVPLYYSRDKVESNTEERIVLSPSGRQ
ncbi:MAG: penicillin acylase family protein [Chloroflexota bacterium]|nr:penicillin acylase family protein [Chloroflexota bacterium]